MTSGASTTQSSFSSYGGNFRNKIFIAIEHIIFTNEMFFRHNIKIISYPLLPNYVYLYKNFFQININMFAFFLDKGHARLRLVISRKNYDNVANLFYWTNYNAFIISILRSISHITKSLIKCIFVYDIIIIYYWRKFFSDTYNIAW